MPDKPPIDSKWYVDLISNATVMELTQSLDLLINQMNGTFSSQMFWCWITSNFQSPVVELVEVIPKDYTHVPNKFLNNIHQFDLKEWGLWIHQRWKLLTRTYQGNYTRSSIPMPNPFIIPGGIKGTDFRAFCRILLLGYLLDYKGFAG